MDTMGLEQGDGWQDGASIDTTDNGTPKAKALEASKRIVHALA